MTDEIRPLVLVMAGVDSGGGAGITADCLTIHDNGAWALPCVTALTAQSLRQVAAVSATDEVFFEKTLEVLLCDFEKIAAVKIGVITTAVILEKTLEFLNGPLKGVPVVWDPVLNATAGRLESADLKANLDRILAVTTVFTPNLPEAMELAGFDENRLQEKGTVNLGRFFLEHGARSVLIKGGHVSQAQDAVDIFVSEDQCFSMSKPKCKGDGAHGGGCALSSATAALIARGFTPEEAVKNAKAYVYRGIKEPALPYNAYRPPIGHHGQIKDSVYMPEIRKLS